MTQDERAALERLLEYVGRGFCAVQADCKRLREYLKNRTALDVLTDSFLAASEVKRSTRTSSTKGTKTPKRKR